jgi:hypothetical protein
MRCRSGLTTLDGRIYYLIIYLSCHHLTQKPNSRHNMVMVVVRQSRWEIVITKPSKPNPPISPFQQTEARNEEHAT